jgi:hypothetical protein
MSTSAVLDDLDGRVVVVTGASKGVGRGIARYLAWRGARLVVSARGQEGLDALSRELTELGAPHVARPADAADRVANFELVRMAVDAFGTSTASSPTPSRRPTRSESRTCATTTSTYRSPPASRAPCGSCRRHSPSCASRAAGGS